MAYHVSLINTESKNQSIKLIRNRDKFRNFLIKEFDMVEEFDKEGNLQLYYDKNDPEFTIFYTEGIEGEYYINTTEDRCIEKLISIAKKLNDGTRVRGDEGETYKTLQDVYIHPDDVEVKNLSFSERVKGWIKDNMCLIIWGVISLIVLLNKMEYL